MTLYAAERWQEAQALADALRREHPDSVSYQGLWGAINAQRGDRVRAVGADSTLARLTSPNLHGLATYWRACIAARLADRDRAVTLLHQAQAEGLQALTFPIRYGTYGFLYYDYLHRDPSFESLHDYVPFQRIVRPKG